MKNKFTILGIGIFAWIAIRLFAFLAERTVNDIFFHHDISPTTNYTISKLLNIVVFIVGILFLLKTIKSENFDENRTLKFVFLLVFLATILQIIMPLFIFPKVNPYSFNSNSGKYYYFTQTTLITILNFILEISVYVFTYFIIMKNKKLNSIEE